MDPGNRDGTLLVQPPVSCIIVFVTLIHATLLYDDLWVEALSGESWRAGEEFLEQLENCVRDWEWVYPTLFTRWSRAIGQSRDEDVRRARDQVGRKAVDILRTELRGGGNRQECYVQLVPFLDFDEYRTDGWVPYHQRDIQEARVGALDGDQTELMETCLTVSLGITDWSDVAVREQPGDPRVGVGGVSADTYHHNLDSTQLELIEEAETFPHRFMVYVISPNSEFLRID